MTVKGVREGEAKGKFGRVWESRREPLAEDGYIEVKVKGRKLRLSDIGWEGRGPPEHFRASFSRRGGPRLSCIP
ncbi:MAG TPA: hypothetical protein EYP65_02070 [Armatimonadetes bacterium]|nr:hypothetical protein [Armatimonadota bacterium]